MKPECSMIELPLELAQKCDDFAQRLVAHYAQGGSPQSRAFSSHGAESNPLLLCEAKVGECVFALHMEQDPHSRLNWAGDRPDSDYDIAIGRTLVDVKQTGLYGSFLIWPINKNRIFDSKDFHVLALTKTSVVRDADGKIVVARGYVEGWSGKQWFRLRRKIAPDGPAGKKLDVGTRYLPVDFLHRMAVFPGHSTDEREHYCWCGEWGSRGKHVSLREGKPGDWSCEPHM